MPATIQRLSSDVWSSSPAIANLSPAAAMAYLAARWIALEDGDCNWDGAGRPADVLLPASSLTAERCWSLLPRPGMSPEQVEQGLAELLASNAVKLVAGVYLFIGLGAENAERYRERERKRVKRHRSAIKLSGGQPQTEGGETAARRAAAIKPTRVTAYIAWFAEQYRAELGVEYVITNRQKERGCAQRLLSQLEARDLAARTVRFLRSGDEFIERAGKSIPILASCINKPEVAGATTAKTGKTRTDDSIASIRDAFRA